MEGVLVALAPSNHKEITIDEITTRYAVEAIFVHFQDFFFRPLEQGGRCCSFQKFLVACTTSTGARGKYENVT